MNSSVLGFNGERLDPISVTTPLGNGCRTYSPTLTRFHHPDNLSPFGAGGINLYIYCDGEPVNRADPSGHFSLGQGIGMAMGFLAGIALSILTEGAAMPVALTLMATVAGDATIGAGTELINQVVDRQRINWGQVGIAAGLSAAASLAGFGLARLTKQISQAKPLLCGRGPMLAADASGHLRPLDGVNPHNFRFLGQSPGYEWGGFHNWLDYSFYDYINGELRLNVATHGSSGRVSRLMLADAGDNGFTVVQAMTWFRNNNYPLESGMIKRIRFLMCGGAKNGYGSFVAKFAEASGITTTGWAGFLGIDGPLDDLLRGSDMKFPGNRIFVAGIGEHFVESSSQTSDLLHLSDGMPVTYRPVHPGLMEQDACAYF